MRPTLAFSVSAPATARRHLTPGPLMSAPFLTGLFMARESNLEPLLASSSGRNPSAARATGGLLTGNFTFGGTPVSRVAQHARGRRQRQAGLAGFAVRQESRKSQEAGRDSAEHSGRGYEEQSRNILSSGAAQVSNLVNTLLFGAASRLERGTSVCVSCRGTGTMICKACNATGVLDGSEKRGTPSSLQTLVGTKSKEKEWIVSNRCKKCRGHGRLTCPVCDGLGKRNLYESM